MKKLLKRMIALIMLMTICVTSIYTSAYAQTPWDGVTNQKVLEGERCKATFKLVSSWNDGYNASIKIENTSDTVIQNWYLCLEYLSDISNIWNAEIFTKEENVYIIKNAIWNQDIAVGGFVEFGFSGVGQFKSFPEKFEILSSSGEIEKEKYSIEYNLDNDWKSGFVSTFNITNNTIDIKEDWILEFDFDRDITEIWNAVIESHEGNHYVIRNAGYNSNISPQGKVTFGIKGTNGDINDEPSNYKLYTYDVSKELDILSVSKDNLVIDDEKYVLNDDFNTFIGELQRVDEVTEFNMYVYDEKNVLIYETEIEPQKNWKNKDIGLIYGYNKIVFKAKIGFRVDIEEIVVDCTSLRFVESLNLDMGDTDGDELPNYFENYFGTNPEMKDTDGDELTDYQELYDLSYSPLKADTDGNNINDGNEDADEDGVGNAVEYCIGSNPLDMDSDNDRLDDGMEIDFETSPIMIDTDEDGITDYEEYVMKELNAQYDSETNTYTAYFSADEMGIIYDSSVVPSVKLTSDAEGIMSFNIKKVESDYYLNPSMVGYIGSAYDFSTKGNMLEAELTFTYNEELLEKDMINSGEFCPTIYYFNPDNGSLTEVEGQEWLGNKVTVMLEHFSTYILINKIDLEEFWNETLAIDEESNMTIGNHTVFVMDKSGSMVSNDPNFIRTSMVKEFCKKMGKNDKIGLIGFADSGVKYSSYLTADEGEIEKAISLFEKQVDSGGTYMNKGLELAVDMLTEADCYNIKRSIFILTDGYISDKISDAYLEDLRKQDITVYTVGMGSVSQTYLKKIAEATGGEYFYAETSSDLKEVFIDFEEEINYDKNCDGLNDELTKLICKGEITTITGTKIFCSQKNEQSWEEMYNLIMSDEDGDLDDDGLVNGKEIEIYYIGERPYIELKSSPELVDSDCDMIPDYDEVELYYTNPRVFNYIVDSKDFQYVSDYKNFESGQAYDDYLDRSNWTIVSEFMANVLLFGGEGNINKIERQELTDYFLSFAQENSEELEYTETLTTYSNYLRGFCDILPGMELGIDRFYTTQKINYFQNEIMSLRNAAYSKDFKNILKRDIKELNETFLKHVEDVIDKGGTSKLSKYGTYAGFALTVLTCGAQCWEEYISYNTALNVVCNYENILEVLMYCGNENVEFAAQQVSKDMKDTFSKYTTIANDVVYSVYSYGTTTFEGYLLTASFGIYGLVADLVWFAASLECGDAINNKISNYAAVDCAIGINRAVTSVLYEGEWFTNVYGDGNINIIGRKAQQEARSLFGASIYAKKWCESKYLSYVEDEKSENYINIIKENIEELDVLWKIYR